MGKGGRGMDTLFFNLEQRRLQDGGADPRLLERLEHFCKCKWQKENYTNGMFTFCLTPPLTGLNTYARS